MGRNSVVASLQKHLARARSLVIELLLRLEEDLMLFLLHVVLILALNHVTLVKELRVVLILKKARCMHSKVLIRAQINDVPLIIDIDAIPESMLPKLTDMPNLRVIMWI